MARRKASRSGRGRRTSTTCTSELRRTVRSFGWTLSGTHGAYGHCENAAAARQVINTARVSKHAAMNLGLDPSGGSTLVDSFNIVLLRCEMCLKATTRAMDLVPYDDPYTLQTSYFCMTKCFNEFREQQKMAPMSNTKLKRGIMVDNGWMESKERQTRELAKRLANLIRRRKQMRKVFTKSKCPIVKDITELNELMNFALRDGWVGKFVFIPSIRNFLLVQKMSKVIFCQPRRRSRA